ncbi:MAG: glycosyltransferase family 4 protein [Bacteroidetes bacterium]|nr:glycosyltransferase family 4 protein [Bacteroidota bacterium]
MSIVLVVQSFPKLSETFIFRKFAGLLRKGWDVHVVCNESDVAEWLHFVEGVHRGDAENVEGKPSASQRSESRRSRVHTGWPHTPHWLAGMLIPFAMIHCLAKNPAGTIRYLRLGWKQSGIGVLKKLYTDRPIICLNPDVVHFEFGALAVGRMHLKELLQCRIVVSFRGYDLNFTGLAAGRNSSFASTGLTGPIQENRVTAAGPILENRVTAVGPIQENRATAVGSMQENRVTVAGPIQENRGTAAGPILENRGTAAGPILENRATAAGPILENRATTAGPILENRVTAAGPIQENRVTAVGPILENRVTGDGAKYYHDVWDKADVIHLLGNDLWRRAQERGCPPAKRHVLIPPAIDPEMFNPGDRSHQGVAGTTERPVRILSVGRLEWKKGYEYALRAVRQLVDRGVSVEYHIVGSGAYLEALTFARYEMGLEQVVHFDGALSPDIVRDKMNWADLLLHAAVSEGFCNAVMEAQAMKLPVVCSDAGGLPENVVDGVTGFVVVRRNPDALAEKIEILARDAGLRQRMGEAGRERVRRFFRIENQIAAFEEMYRQVERLAGVAQFSNPAASGQTEEYVIPGLSRQPSTNEAQ